MTKDIEREAFDAYFRDKYPELYKDVFDEDGDDRAIIGYSFAWQSWQAVKAHEAEKLKGYVVVPVEPTQAMIDAVRSEHEGEPYLPYSLYKSFLKAAAVEAARGGNE